jgi:organic radical activating enzyme
MDRFKRIYIEVTNCCNLQCSYCPKSSRPKEFMAPEAFESILTRIKGYTRYIYLHVLGEPTLHPQLAELLELSHNHHFKVNLTTNGTLLRQTREILLASPALRQINISLHNEGQSDLTGVSDYLRTVLSFIDSAREKTIFINLRLWDAGKTEAPPDKDREILRLLAEKFALPESFGDLLHPGRSLTLAPGIFLSRERQFTWPREGLPEITRRGSCKGLRDHIAILVDGTVVPCCLDGEGNIGLGNIHQHQLDQILAGAGAIRMRIGFRNQQLVEPLCRRCDYRMRFGAG